MIVHVTPSYPPRLGGLEKVVQMLARTQHSNGHEVRVYTSDQGTDKHISPESYMVKRLRSFVLANTTIIPGLFFALFSLKKTDTIHLHITQALTPEIVWLISKIRRVRYVAHVHLDIPPSGSAGFLLKIYKPIFLKKVLQDAFKVVVFTNDQKVDMHNNYAVPYDRIQVIPNGVDSSYYYKKRDRANKILKILFVGRLSYQKNLLQLLQGLEGVSENYSTTIIGDGELREELVELAKTLELKNVTFTGRMEGQKLKQQYIEADIFVLTSEREGMPLVLLEAMAMGLPTIATDVTGNRDVIENGMNGILIPYNDPTALKTELGRIRKDSKTYRMLSKNALASSLNYSWDKVAAQCDVLYREPV